MSQINPIKSINTRREVTLAGFVYTMPSIVGSGLRTKVSEYQMRRYMGERDITKMPKEEQDAFLMEFETSFKIWTIRNAYDSTVAILEGLLTPIGDSPSVEEAYDMANDEEVNIIMDFFKGNASNKTEELPNLEENSSSLIVSESEKTPTTPLAEPEVVEAQTPSV